MDMNERMFLNTQNFQKQAFEQKMIEKQILASEAQTQEIVRTLKQYNNMVETFYFETKEELQKQHEETAKLEKTKKRLTITSIFIALAGVVASVIVGIFF